MWAQPELMDFAMSAGAQVHLREGDGLALTWDCGRSWRHVWKTHGSDAQSFYGESEYAEERWPHFVSNDHDLMLRWAILRIGSEARRRLEWAPIVVPSEAEGLDGRWGVEQLSLITGRLTMDGVPLPMDMRTIFPEHHELNQFARVALMDVDDLVAAYRDPSGGALLGHWVR